MGTKKSAVLDAPLMKASEGGSISRPTAPASRLQGGDQDDLILPRVHIFQGLPDERKRYGSFNPGDLIDTLTMEKIEARKFAPIFGYKQWIRWADQRGAGMVYSHRDKADVPAADLDWVGDEPPVAQEYINWVVLFEGETTPHVLSFTKTAIKAGRTINTLEAMRRNKGIGLYAMELKEKQNDQGTWLSPQIRPAGDPPEEMAELCGQLYASLADRPVETNVAEDGGGGFNPDAH